MIETDEHKYSSLFYDYTDAGANRSAKRFAGFLQPVLGIRSLADFGCGRGTWLKQWANAGVEDIIGVDGDYVVRSELKIPEERFRAHDITQSLDLDRQFDLVQSLEVAEHLPAKAAPVFVDTLTRHGNRILFSAAVPGQGGEFHVNEQPLDYWRALFRERGYFPYDFMRPHFTNDTEVQRWYRYNTVIYVNDAGREDLPDDIKATRIEDGVAFRDYSDFAWKIRRAVVRGLPQSMVNRISQVRAEIIAQRAKRKLRSLSGQS